MIPITTTTTTTSTTTTSTTMAHSNALMSLVTTSQPSPHHNQHHHQHHQQQLQYPLHDPKESTNNATTATRKRCQAELRLTSIDTTILASSSSSSSSCSSSSSSLLDFQSLQSSLKRVRLSMSPGELRLERDLRNLVTCEGWNKVEQHVWLFGGDKSSTLEQTPGDPLRLVLVTHQVSVFLQIPRRYPHRPPVVSRVIYPATAAQPRTKGTIASTTTGDATTWLSSKINDKAMPSSPPRRGRIETILVHDAPPVSSNADSFFTFGNPSQPSPSSAAATAAAVASGATTADTLAIYNEWSPVKRLGDLLRFIMDVLEPQHEHLPQPSEQRQDYDNSSSSSNPAGSAYLENHSEESLTMSWDASESPHPISLQSSSRHLFRPSGQSNLNTATLSRTHQRLKLEDEDHRELVNQLSASLKSSSMEGGFDTNNNGNGNLTGSSKTPNCFFVEEHKSMNEMEFFELDSSYSMDEMTASNPSSNTPTKRKIHNPLPFPPNRFDVGYVKATRTSLADTSPTSGSRSMRATTNTTTMPVGIRPFSSLDWNETTTPTMTSSTDVYHMDLL